jgi:transcriptional regulator with XRE-family HTH domain
MATAKKESAGALIALGQRAKFLRERIGFSVREAAERLGLHDSSLSRLEQGKRSIELESLIALADLYHAKLDWLLAARGPLDPLPPHIRRGTGDRRRAAQ